MRKQRTLRLALRAGAKLTVGGWRAAGLAPLACGVGLILAVLPLVALASTDSVTGIEASLPASAGPLADAFLQSVSCASTGNCTAVGFYDDSSGPFSDGLLFTETSGTWATGVEAPLPANAKTLSSSSQFLQLSSVSCASAGNCSAVGRYETSSGYSQGLLLTDTSGTWATGVEAPLPANASTNKSSAGAQLNSVSCASAGNCAAVGDYYDSSDQSDGLFLTETPGSMSAPGSGSAPGSTLALIGRPAVTAAGVTDKLACARSALLPCQATETLTTTETTQGGRPVALSASVRRKFRKVVVATKTVMIQPGKKVSVMVKLNATGRKLLARFGRLPVALKITLLQNGRHLVIANTKLTVKRKRK